MSTRDDPEAIARLFSENVSLEIPGDEGALPWIGRAFGHQAIARWMDDLGALLEPQAFDVEDILASESRAAAIGSLQARIKATGKMTTTPFVLILTVTDGLISRLQMLEDSFDVSKAARL
ncbi:nuclear transport factor 2 family protein [Sphingomonas sp. UV9]|nr:nuclear transport factor 2 family protein [Sphingomonas sp. UV9]